MELDSQENAMGENIFKRLFVVLAFIMLTIGLLGVGLTQKKEAVFISPDNLSEIDLPKPILESSVSIEEALLKRKSTRKFKDEPLSLEDLSQLLWAAQGITSDDQNRTAPSAGALYPLEIYVVVGEVTDLSPAVYKYKVKKHALEKVVDGDKRKKLELSALNQSSISKGAIDIVIIAEYKKVEKKYSQRGKRYVHLEAGHSAQNICLQAVSLNLGTVTIGAFNDSKVKSVLNLPENKDPIYILPVGKLK